MFSIAIISNINSFKMLIDGNLTHYAETLIKHQSIKTSNHNSTEFNRGITTKISQSKPLEIISILNDKTSK